MNRHTLHVRAQNARLALHLTQQAVAERVGCSQAAISYFESGNLGALSRERTERMLEILGVAGSPETLAAGRPPENAAAEDFAFCSSRDCPTGIPEVINGQLIVRPKIFRVAEYMHPNHCIACGNPLSYGCSDCTTELVAGAAFCTGCGRPLVPVTPTAPGTDLEELAEILRARAERYRSTTFAVDPLPRPEPRNSGKRLRSKVEPYLPP